MKAPKVIKLFLIIALSIWLPTGCDREEYARDSNVSTAEGRGDILFSIGLASQTRLGTADDLTSSWEHGDEIGIFATQHGVPLSSTAATNFIHNVKLTYNKAGDGSWSSSEPLLFEGNHVLGFYAYYPYDDNDGSPASLNPLGISFRVMDNQDGDTESNGTDKSNYDLSHLLTARADNGGEGYSREDFKNRPVTLTLSHALSLVQVKVSSQENDADLRENLVVKLRGMKTDVVLDLGAVSATAGSEISLPVAGNDPLDIVMHRVEQPGDANYDNSFTYRALVPAQHITQGNRLFRFELGSQQLIDSNTLDTALTLRAGRIELYEITLPSNF